MWWHLVIGLAVALVIATVWAIGVNWTWHHLELPMPYVWQSDRMEREWKLELGHECVPGDELVRVFLDERECFCVRCRRWIPEHLIDHSLCQYARTL